MILLDTHVWLWWVNGDSSISSTARQALNNAPVRSIGISAICCWEVAALVAGNKLRLSLPVEEWLKKAVCNPRQYVLPIAWEAAVASALLPGPLHRDPADRLLIAEARRHGCALLTADRRILRYTQVLAITPDQVSAWQPYLTSV